ncbi:MAG: T9SS type A sorting domain-containing protein [Ignavibacteriales bacterium]|nr:T9SS type A sorting domain-containing protein [Ignavibacteriales bacterium]
MPGKSFVPADVILYAQSVTNNLIYNYGFTQIDGTFDIGFLPQGTYKLVAQRIGFSDAFSKEFSVDPANPMVDSIELTFYLTSADNGGNIIPEEMVLYQNYPNPFNPSTTIEFSVPVRTNVSLKITNLLGQQVAELYNGEIVSGIQKFTFDASQLSSGVYIINLITPGSRLTKKILLLK